MSKRKSIVWNNSDPSENKKQAICNLCGRTYSTGGGTSNLHDHLKRLHKDHFNTDDNSNKIVKYSAYSGEKKKIDEALKNFIVSDMQSFSIVENKAFQVFVKVLNPKYTLPCRHTLSNVSCLIYSSDLK